MITDQQIAFDQGCENLDRLVRLNALAKGIYEANPDNSTIDIMDITNREVQDFLLALHRHDVRYMLVGGVATVFHGHVRTTQDLDLWIEDTSENKKRLVQVLKDLKVPGAEHYEKIEMVPGWSTLTIGEKGFTADLMGYMKAFKKEDFGSCYKGARKGMFEGIPITVINMLDLIKEKEALARPKDLDDAQNLRKIRKSIKKNRGRSL